MKANLTTASISGNSDDGQNVSPDGQQYPFKSQLYDAGAQIEFNFFNFGIGPNYKKLMRLSPYLSVGIGATVASTSGTTGFAMNLPMGVGVKFKLRERLKLGLEFSMRKVF